MQVSSHARPFTLILMTAKGFEALMPGRVFWLTTEEVSSKKEDTVLTLCGFGDSAGPCGNRFREKMAPDDLSAFGLTALLLLRERQRLS